MLDQNTDRMWYVIGAVIIGAAIIFILNNTFPQLFASIGDTFTDKTDEVSTTVDELTLTDGIGPKSPDYYLGEDDLWLRNVEKVAYDASTRTWTLNNTPGSITLNNGFQVNKGQVLIPYGETLTLSYEVYIPEGIDGLYAVTDLNNLSVNHENRTWYAGENDNDNKLLRRYVSGATQNTLPYQMKVPLSAGQWTTVWLSYTNSNPANVDKETLKDATTFGVSNTTGQTIQMKIRNIKAEVK